jgi:hypothetical protein
VGVVTALTLADALLAGPAVDAVGTLLLDYAVILAAFALILGLVHLLRVHLRRVTQRQEGWFYSLFLVAVALVFTIAGVIEGPGGTVTQWGLTTLLIPLQAAFFALLPFFLITVLVRTTKGRSLDALLLAGTALLVVLAGTPAAATYAPWLETLRTWVIDTISSAGARALLLGIGLGTVVTAFRFVADGRRLFR